MSKDREAFSTSARIEPWLLAQFRTWLTQCLTPQVHVRGLEHVRGIDHGVLAIMPHNGHADAPLARLALPPDKRRRYCAAAGKDYWQSLGKQVLSSLFLQTILFDRSGGSNSKDALEMTAALAQQQFVGYFPEGTRSKDPYVPLGERQIKPGLARMMLMAPGVPVIPVLLINTERLLPKGSSFPRRWRYASEDTDHIDVVFGTSMYGRDFEGQTPESVTAAIREVFLGIQPS